MRRRTFLGGLAAMPLMGALAACARNVIKGGRTLEPLNGAPETVGFSAAGIAALNTEMGRQVDARTLSGLVHLLARHGKIVNLQAYGKRSIASGLPMRTDGIFRIHSQSKPIVAAAMMALYDEGRWALDDPITRFIPEFANLKVQTGVNAAGERVVVDAERPPTMRELMNHTAGFSYGVGGDTPTDERVFAEIWHEGRNEFMSFDQMIATLATIPLLFQPGTDWKYSIASDIQGVLIERMSRQSFSDFLKAKIFDPLDMPDTRFLITPAQAERLVGFYIFDENNALKELHSTDEWIFPIDHTKPAAPFYSGGGGLVSTARDFGHFSQMLLNRGELDGVRVLSADAVELMTSDQIPASITPKTQDAYGGEGQGFGFGMVILRDPARAGLRAPAGAALWGGLGGTWFLLDKQNDLFFVGLAQRAAEVPPEDNLPTVSANSLYAALADPSA